ncbi:hypothetical protein BDN67DRAFT_258341 [Paxillus ammoniavirescens]|nr:hypothetical protein BDN67DRAFT_258341 [Paxillus ammoniavirescens]
MSNNTATDLLPDCYRRNRQVSATAHRERQRPSLVVDQQQSSVSKPPSLWLSTTSVQCPSSHYSRARVCAMRKAASPMPASSAGFLRTAGGVTDCPPAVQPAINPSNLDVHVDVLSTWHRLCARSTLFQTSKLHSMNTVGGTGSDRQPRAAV